MTIMMTMLKYIVIHLAQLSIISQKSYVLTLYTERGNTIKDVIT